MLCRRVRVRVQNTPEKPHCTIVMLVLSATNMRHPYACWFTVPASTPLTWPYVRSTGFFLHLSLNPLRVSVSILRTCMSGFSTIPLPYSPEDSHWVGFRCRCLMSCTNNSRPEDLGLAPSAQRLLGVTAVAKQRRKLYRYEM